MPRSSVIALAVGQDGDIFQHRLPAIAESRSFHGRGLQRAAQLVHNERRQRFAFDVFGNDQQRAAHLGDLFQDGKQILHRADLLFVNQDEAVFQHALHAVRIRHEIRRQVAAIELHPFDDVQRGLDGLGFFNRDDAVLADFLHGFGNDVADRGIIVGGNGRDLRDHVALDRFRKLLDLLGRDFNRAFDAALHGHRIRAGGDVFTPSRKMAWARTVAVVVPSPATSLVLDATSFTIWAPIFSSGSFSSISFATVTPSFVISGEPNFLSRTTLRPLGPSVILTASASMLTPRKIACRESSP